MQILNSQWINCVIFFILFFFGFSLKSAKIARRKTKVTGSTLVVGEWVGTLSGLDMGQGQGQKHVLAEAEMSGIHWISQPLKKSVNRAQTQNYKQHVPYTDMYECKNEWMWMNKWMNEWMNKWMNNWKTWRVNKWMNDRNGQSINQHKKAREAGENSISCHLRVGRVSDNRLTKAFGQERELKISRKRRKSRQTDKARN